MLDLRDREWRGFKIGSVFSQIQRGKRLKKDDHHPGSRPYVSSTAVNNGVDGFVSNKEGVRIFENCLTIANSGSVGATFYHKYTFVASDHVTQLKNPDFTRHIYLFLVPIISRLGEKYSFNREINDMRIRNEVILLPVDKNNNPDWQFMDNYIREREKMLVERYGDYSKKKLI